jgi:hypothetical protein
VPICVVKPKVAKAIRGGMADVFDYKTSAMSFSLFMKTLVTVEVVLLPLVTLGNVT